MLGSNWMPGDGETAPAVFQQGRRFAENCSSQKQGAGRGMARDAGQQWAWSLAKSTPLSTLAASDRPKNGRRWPKSGGRVVPWPGLKTARYCGVIWRVSRAIHEVPWVSLLWSRVFMSWGPGWNFQGSKIPPFALGAPETQVGTCSAAPRTPRAKSCSAREQCASSAQGWGVGPRANRPFRVDWCNQIRHQKPGRPAPGRPHAACPEKAAVLGRPASGCGQGGARARLWRAPLSPVQPWSWGVG